MSVSALEISQYFLRAIRLSKKGNSLVPEAVVEESLKAGTIENGLIKNETAFEESLRLLVKKFRFSGSNWVISLPEAAVFSIYRSFPNIPSENIRETIEVNYLNFLPGKAENIYWGFQEVGRKGAAKEVLISSIKKEHLDPYLNCLSKLGMVPIAVEPRSCSIARVFGQTPATLVVNIEKSPEDEPWVLTATILADGYPEVSRETNLGGHPMEELLKAVRGIINYYSAEKKNDGIKTMILDGNCLSQPIEENLKTAFGIDLKRAAELFGSFKIRPFSLALLGAGLRAASGARQDSSLSLLPVGTQEAYKEKNILQSLRGITNICSITAVLFLAIFLGVIFLLYTLGNQADKQIAGLAKTNQENLDPKVAEIQNVLKEVNPKIEIEAKVQDQIKVFSPALVQILGLLTDGVGLNQISLTKDDQPLVLTGESSSQEALVNFRENLAKLSFVTAVQMPSSNVNAEGSINFTLNLTLNSQALAGKNY